MEFRDLKKQYQVLKPQMDAAIGKVLQDCNFISGKQVAELEEKLAQYVGVKHCVTCGNGTDALSLVMMAWEIKKGTRCLCRTSPSLPARRWSPLRERPRFLSMWTSVPSTSTRTSWSRPSVRSSRRASCARARWVAVDLFGQPADYRRIEEICRRHNLLLLEDGAQGFGGMLDGRRACSFGDAAATSFFPAKPLGCYGDGGAVFTNDDNLAELLRSLRIHGKSPVSKYDNIRIGINSRLDTVQAAVLQVKFEAFQQHELEDVNRAAELYTQYLGGIVKTPVIRRAFIPAGRSTPSFWKAASSATGCSTRSRNRASRP